MNRFTLQSRAQKKHSEFSQTPSGAFRHQRVYFQCPATTIYQHYQHSAHAPGSSQLQNVATRAVPSDNILHESETVMLQDLESNSMDKESTKNSLQALPVQNSESLSMSEEALTHDKDQAVSSSGRSMSAPPSNLTGAIISKTGRIFYYQWPRLRPAMPRPLFLQDYPVPEEGQPNINSFFGVKDTNQGRLYVSRSQYSKFLYEYLRAFRDGHYLTLSEKYYREPYRFFSELDFDWDYDIQHVTAVTNQVIDIVIEAIKSLYSSSETPQCLVSMRTPYKVHLNFPTVITTDNLARVCREMILERCKETFVSGPPADMDWEKIVDSPHGSLRLLGSRKVRHMDKDPAWVSDKAYYPVIWREEEQRWSPTGIYHSLLMKMSIFPDSVQLREFEESPTFRDMAYMDVEAYRLKQAEKRTKRQRSLEERVTTTSLT
ncbi:hypothetical protein CEUSTIGMA_g6581.t1 [Chlamydomonas eustigma]|uniref:C962R-like N-terminal AEP domain-containing protein n=1 Tax=Chlamydomonas eustigma TaxID=1157962 RepID=A0A250X7S4_9CHLO|nr:hypothetical protein CEUSTIGMA_g6581.t1 [Chlamydomonas eustigma]|eukprot:GAX79141.1 hypothetical protein CEUSTIGMA_g6581.t1 [Chlamydomonas eustigma]